jgi:hypothetical protein
VNYTAEGDGGDTRVERYRVSSDPTRADPSSAFLILEVEQPESNHNGGHVEFGPDGMLYIGLGDGGGSNDQFGNGQNRGTLLGTILRIDVDGGSPYAIPSNNPFVSTTGARPEIWAYGLRNPWRFSIDPADSRIYIGDVGQSALEEIDVAPLSAGGLNYGWNIMEGKSCFRATSCNMDGLTLPVLEYGHNQGCSVTGGLVYRGTAIPGLVGHYVYSDYCGAWLRSFLMEESGPTHEKNWDEVQNLDAVTSFGRDGAGEILVLTVDSEGGGELFRVIPRQ